MAGKRVRTTNRVIMNRISKETRVITLLLIVSLRKSSERLESTLASWNGIGIDKRRKGITREETSINSVVPDVSEKARFLSRIA